MFLINSASDCQASLDLCSSKSIKTDSDSKLVLTLIVLRTACLLACWAFFAFHVTKIKTYVSFVDAFFYNLQMAKIGLWIFSGGLLILAIVGGICCCLQVYSKMNIKSTQAFTQVKKTWRVPINRVQCLSMLSIFKRFCQQFFIAFYINEQ